MIATVEAVDPIILSMKLVENCENNGCSCSCGCDPSDIPPCITSCFPGELSMGSEEDPCALFRKVQFPTEEFFPPNTVAPPEGYQEAKHCDPCCQG